MSLLRSVFIWCNCKHFYEQKWQIHNFSCGPSIVVVHFNDARIFRVLALNGGKNGSLIIMTANTLINNLKVNNNQLREKVVVNVSLCHTRTSSDSVWINIRNAIIKIGGWKYACIRNDTYSYFMLEFLISNQQICHSKFQRLVSLS